MPLIRYDDGGGYDLLRVGSSLARDTACCCGGYTEITDCGVGKTIYVADSYDVDFTGSYGSDGCAAPNDQYCDPNNDPSEVRTFNYSSYNYAGGIVTLNFNDPASAPTGIGWAFSITINCDGTSNLIVQASVTGTCTPSAKTLVWRETPAHQFDVRTLSGSPSYYSGDLCGTYPDPISYAPA